MKKPIKLMAGILCVCLLLGSLPVVAAEQAAKPSVRMQDHSDMVIHYECGTSAESLQVNATKSDAGTLSYQWYTTESENGEGTPIPGATDKKYKPDTSRETGLLWYYCVVTNTLNGTAASAESPRQPIAIGPTVTVTAYLSISNDDQYVSGESGQIMALKEIEVPYFDLRLYGLEGYYFSSESYGSNGEYEPGVTQKPESNLQAGTSAFAYGKVTLMHMLIYALEVHYLGLDPENAGQGYLYTSGALGTDALSYTGGVGSSYMVHFWGHDENLNYYRNYCYPLASEGWGSTSDQILLREGDIYTVGMFSDWSFYSDDVAGFHHFTDGDEQLRAVVEQGDKKTLTLKRSYGFESSGYTTNHPTVTTGLDVYMVRTEDLADGDVYSWDYHLGTTDENGEITIDTAEWEMEPGEYLVCVAGQYSEDRPDNIVSTPGGILLQVTEKSSASEQIKGDINGSGAPDSSDAVLILSSISQSTQLDLAVADMNGDGEVDSSDAVLILRAVSEN